MTDEAPETTQPPQPPVEVDVSDHDAVLRALGFDPDQVQAVVLTRTGRLAIAADYPPTEHDPEPEPEPEPEVPDDPEEI
ncbi:hypothetical protein GCM10009718_36980 [Isoptericola halotolerans]